MRRTPGGRRRLAVAIAAGAVVGAWAVPLLGGGGPEPQPVSRTSYVVRPGDTLWSIAERVNPGADPRPLVDAISSANRVDAGSLVPGQTLLIPAAS